MARASNPENHPRPRPIQKPPPAKKSFQSEFPELVVHGHQPNFPDQPGPKGDRIDMGAKGDVEHGWFHP